MACTDRGPVAWCCDAGIRNERLAWAAAAVFLWINGHDLDAPEDGAFDLVIAVADRSLTDVEKIAEHLAGWSRPR